MKDAYPAHSEADVAAHMMQFAYHLCLAQAQECILEKSMMDNRKASIIGMSSYYENFYFLCQFYMSNGSLKASICFVHSISILFPVKVAVQVVNYYSQAFNALRQSALEDAVAIKTYAVMSSCLPLKLCL